jgi:Raf kinase inhibitor-like YbhB/YbcL family protein
MKFLLTSTAFEEGQHIPLDHTADGKDLSPTLKWTDPPEGTRSFALICEDPDAPRGMFTHWLVYNLPVASREMSEGITHSEGYPNGTLQGTNDFGKLGWNGPSPPAGQSHRYVFILYALDRMLDLPASAHRKELLHALKGHILAETRLTAHYGRGEIHEIPDDPLKKKALQDRESIHTAPLS